jgi:hypothetical protein
MNCPACKRRFLALFICADGVHRCLFCKDSAPSAPVPPPPRESTFKATPGPKQGFAYKSPYVQRVKKPAAAKPAAPPPPKPPPKPELVATVTFDDETEEKSDATPVIRRKRSLGRLTILGMIEKELRQKMTDIEAMPNWRENEVFSASYFAYAQSIQIVRDHHVIIDGKPMRSSP